MTPIRRAGVTVLAMLALGLTAGACAATPSGAAGGTSATGSEPTGTFGATPPTPTRTTAGGGTSPRPAGCGLRASLRGASSAKFQQAVTVVLTNTSARTCAVSGYLAVAFAHGGRRLAITTTHHAGPTPPLTVRPGGRVSAMLLWNKYEGQGATCPPYADTVVITPPGGYAASGVPWLTVPGGSICGGTVEVWPLQAA